jgi:hypothetical protein
MQYKLYWYVGNAVQTTSHLRRLQYLLNHYKNSNRTIKFVGRYKQKPTNYRPPEKEIKWYYKEKNNSGSKQINPLTPELNPSEQRYLTWFLLGILLLEPWISLIYAWKTNKYTNYSFALLIMYGSSYMFRHYIAILRERS